MSKRKLNLENAIIIDGRFFTQKLTGVQRLGFELLEAFKELEDFKAIVALPPDAPDMPPQDGNISYVKVGKLKNNLWEQWTLPRYAKKAGLPLLCTGNYSPILYKHFVILHDVRFKEKRDYKEKKSWLRKISFLVRAYIYKSKAVFTVSEFSADRIMHFYPKLKRRPVVIYSGYEHVLKWKEEEVKDVPDEFYFSVGTANLNKNFAYVLELAKANPDKNFIIAGNPVPKFTENAEKNGVNNFRFLGYITDGQMAWLYKHCRGFILPSTYEGFGLPPLEAVASGCRALYLSDIPVFKEVYGDAARFFDPYDYENTVNLGGGRTMTDGQAQELLEKCSWKKMAETVRLIMLGKNEQI